MHLIILNLLLILVSLVHGHHERSNMLQNRTTMVHLFEWKWKDIADECERFLAPKGYGGVQISPPSENLIIHTGNGTRPWYERYQVMSYKLKTRSGDRSDFLNMTRRCNDVGVRIYADVVFNHMCGNHADNIGTGGSTADFLNYDYPGVPYNNTNFHYPHCIINNYNNASEVRNCELLGLMDLDQSQDYVRTKIINFLNELVDIGVAGFRIDAAKHMWPEDLGQIYNQINDLNTEFGFEENKRPYIYQEVIHNGNEPILPSDYTPLGDVTEFKVGYELKNVFRGENLAKWLKNWGVEWSLLPSENALVFIDNHDTQRSSDVLTYKEARNYKAAIAFILAFPYGVIRVMSSFSFDNSDQGPPSDDNEVIVSPLINDDDTCGNGWVCEHRWRQIYQMAAFRNAVENSTVDNWWDNDSKQIAFGRGGKGFFVYNGDDLALNQTLQTGLPAGEYCDVITGKKLGTECSGCKISVDSESLAHFFIPSDAEDMHMAIHVGLESRICQ